MSFFIFNGQKVPVYGLTVRTWLDNPAWHLTTEDRKPRGVAAQHTKPDIQIVVAHTTMGKVGPVLPGKGPYVDPANKTLKHWASDGDPSATQFWVGPDGTVFQVADIAEECPHAGNRNVNKLSVGFEMYQIPTNTPGGQVFVLHEAQIRAAVELTNNLTRILNIKRQYQWPFLSSGAPPASGAAPSAAWLNGRPPKMLLRPEEGGEGGVRFVGVCGHRDASNDRSRGDPGDAFFEALGRAGYTPRNFDTNPDYTTLAAKEAGKNVVGGGLLGVLNASTVAFAAGGAALWWWLKKKR